MTKLNLKAFVQGKSIDRVVQIELVNSQKEVVSSASGAIDTTGNCEVTFSENITESVSIKISGTSVLTTISSALVEVVNGVITYDFSIDIAQAIGDNQIEISDGVWALYNGDFNQDGVIDGLDLGLFENNENNEQDEILLEDLEFNISNSIYSIGFPIPPR